VSKTPGVLEYCAPPYPMSLWVTYIRDIFLAKLPQRIRPQLINIRFVRVITNQQKSSEFVPTFQTLRTSGREDEYFITDL